MTQRKSLSLCALDSHETKTVISSLQDLRGIAPRTHPAPMQAHGSKGSYKEVVFYSPLLVFLSQAVLLCQAGCPWL